MASTISLQNTANWVSAFIVQRPVTGVNGVANEPFLTAANYAMQTILQNPFKWEWNRKKVVSAITCVAGQSDYSVSLSDYGWLEKAILSIPTPPANTPPNFELEIYEILGTDGLQNRPLKIAVLLDDGAGNITFRLFPVPDEPYTVELDYQKAPITATGLTGTWAPIPDKFAFLYERFMMAQMQMMYNQQLGLSNLELFFRQLVAVAEGLSEMEKAIFLEDVLRDIRSRQTAMEWTPQGKAARV